MATVLEEHTGVGGASDEDGQLSSKLPELDPIKEEEPGDDGEGTRPASRKQDQELQLPHIVPSNTESHSAENLMEMLSLSVTDELSLDVLFKSVRSEVRTALEELTTITTHDDNLEKQYKETVSENTQLQSSLDKARSEIRHLKGQLSILQMTPSEIRQEKARTQHRYNRRQELERQAHRVRSQSAERGAAIEVLTAAERARTVNARGEYIDSQRLHKAKLKHSRGFTYPTAPGNNNRRIPPLSLSGAFKNKPLPPTLIGCTCSECNTQQSLGALTLNRTLCHHQSTNQNTKSGQQILLGDRVVLKGERLGTVCYIGRLDFDLTNQIYIGAHLDLPVGNIDGYLKGRRYFQCPPSHGVMVTANDIICVTGRKPVVGGTAIPRVREKLPKGFDTSHSVSKGSKNKEEAGMCMSPAPYTSNSSLLSLSPVGEAVETELAMLTGDWEGENSVDDMSKRIQQLSQKSSKKSKELQKLQESLKPRLSPTPTPITVHLDESVNLPLSHPPPRPITPQPITPTPPHTAEPSRPSTPLEQTLLELLSDKDLGSTGFVTFSELKGALLELSERIRLTPDQMTQMFTSLNVTSEEGVGLPYYSLVPQIARALQHM